MLVPSLVSLSLSLCLCLSLSLSSALVFIIKAENSTGKARCPLERTGEAVAVGRGEGSLAGRRDAPTDPRYHVLPPPSIQSPHCCCPSSEPPTGKVGALPLAYPELPPTWHLSHPPTAVPSRSCGPGSIMPLHPQGSMTSVGVRSVELSAEPTQDCEGGGKCGVSRKLSVDTEGASR